MAQLQQNQQTAQTQQQIQQQPPHPILISRKARLWPEISKETVTIPPPPNAPPGPMPFMMVTSLFSIFGIIIVELVLSRTGSGASLLPFVGLSAIMGGASLTSFIVQWITARKRTKYLVKAYKKRLQEIEKQLQLLQWKERQASLDLNPPLMPPSVPLDTDKQATVIPLIQRPVNDHDVGLWARRQTDPDFLNVRLGTGKRLTAFKIQAPQLENRIAIRSKLDRVIEFASKLFVQYNSLVAPSALKLDSCSPVAIVGAQQHLLRARELMRVMVSQLAYHHSPEDVRIIILAPYSQEAAWQWATLLPHTIVYDPRRSSDNNEDGRSASHAVACDSEAIIEQLALISRELGRRELLLGDVRSTPLLPNQKSKQGLLPHLVIVVDHFDEAQDLDQATVLLPTVTPGQSNLNVLHRARLSVSPLKRPELTLALSRNELLGVSVVCVCENIADVPTSSETLINLDMKTLPEELETDQPALPQALIRTLRPDPPPVASCDQLDVAPLEALNYFARRMQPLWVVSTKRLEIRVQADLRRLFEPTLDLSTYNPWARWNDPIFRMNVPHKGEVPNMRIPIGLKIADEVQYLDFLKDGPHGLMIGQTGSGKSELLQTVIASLAVAYHPTEVNFLLIDYKAGLALEPFRRLPHTVGFLSNVSSPALIQRFITMLKAEATRREVELKKGVRLPRLIIIIDEFAEMAKRTDAVLDELFTITRVGREIGMHLLLAAQRPEGIIASKVRDYVQYRLCLRCASPEDSREVLRRPDAANLPASIPGRCYLLHGDNQLDLFQAARVALMITLNQPVEDQKPAHSLLSLANEVTTTTTTLAEALIEQIHTSFSREEAQKAGIIYWPDPLPTPITHQAPDPLTLFKDSVDGFAARTSSSQPHGEQAQKRIAVVPVTLRNMLSIPSGNNANPLMQIPLGLIDRPEIQKRETFFVDLHGSSGALTGGPLLIAGAQHSGKATALETLLFWLSVRYPAQQFRCAIIDPVQELDFFQEMPQLQAGDGSSLWTDGSADDKLNKFVELIMGIIDRRRSDFPHQRWDSNTIAQLWAQGIEVPLLLVVVHHYHSFVDRMNATIALKKLSLAAMEARNMGVYLVVTTAETGGRYIPADLVSKFATKVGLFLNEQQRFELFGRPPLVPDLIPGRGLAQTPDRSIHQVQLALPVAGETESERRELLKQTLLWLRSQ